MKAQKDMAEYSIPGYTGAPLDSTAKREFINMKSSAETIKSSLGALSKLVAGVGEGIPFTQKNDKAKQYVNDIQLQLKEIKKLGVLSNADSNRLDYYISNPGILKSDSRMQSEIKGVLALVEKAVSEQEKLLGISPKPLPGKEIK
jgi:hypothetical protein